MLTRGEETQDNRVILNPVEFTRPQPEKRLIIMNPSRNTPQRSASSSQFAALVLGTLLLPLTAVKAQTTVSAGAAAAPAVNTAASGTTAGTFLDMAQAGSWTSGVPTILTDAIFSGGHLGTTAGFSANKLTLGNGTNLYGVSYQPSAATGPQTITLGAGGLSTGSGADSRIGPNLTLALGTTNQNWTVPAGRLINYQGLVSGSATITLDGPGTLWKRDASSAAFTGNWNVTAGTLQVEARFGLGAATATVSLSNNATLRMNSSATVFDRALSVGTGGGRLRASANNVIFNATVSGNGAITTEQTNAFAFNINSDMSAHVGAIAIGRGNTGNTLNFGSGVDPLVSRATVSFNLGANHIVDGIDTTGGGANSLIRPGAGANAISVNFANTLFSINTVSAPTAAGSYSWNLVDSSTSGFNVAYGTMSVSSTAGDFTNSSGVWTRVEGLNSWSFTQATGQLDLTVSAIPEPSAFAAFAGLGMLGVVAVRRRPRS